MSSQLPTEALAAAIAADRLGWEGSRVGRFTTGSSFYVYELSHPQGEAVIRIGRPEQREALIDGLKLNATLRPLGVPLPAIFVDGTNGVLPYFIMQRLAGTDLGGVIADLSGNQRIAIAEAVAAAQLATARLGPGRGYGFAADGAAAPHGAWIDVVTASIERSHRRIAANGLFSTSIVNPLRDRLDALRSEFDAIPPTPFLHDTTTKNVIVAPDGTFSGIVDVDDFCFGDSRFAAALTQAAIIAFGGPMDYVGPWLHRMGQSADDSFRFYVTVFLLNFLGEQGMAFNGNPRPSLPHERQRLLGIYEDALRTLS
ncbi:phosphotransferase [Devosia sp. CAU 1758]